MDKNNKVENENNKKKVNFDKFSTHRGEFVLVSTEILKGKKVTMYAEIIDDEDETKEK